MVAKTVRLVQWVNSAQRGHTFYVIRIAHRFVNEWIANEDASPWPLTLTCPFGCCIERHQVVSADYVLAIGVCSP